MTLVGMASGPATDGLALVAEGAVSGWLCRLRATLGFIEEQECEAARWLLVQLDSERRFERVATDHRFRREAEVSARAPARRGMKMVLGRLLSGSDLTVR